MGAIKLKIPKGFEEFVQGDINIVGSPSKFKN